MVTIGSVILRLQDAHKSFKYNDTDYHFHQQLPIEQKRDKRTGCMEATFLIHKERKFNSMELGLWIDVTLRVWEINVNGLMKMTFNDSKEEFTVAAQVDQFGEITFISPSGIEITI